jgi:hypothetical protein
VLRSCGGCDPAGRPHPSATTEPTATTVVAAIHLDFFMWLLLVSANGRTAYGGDATTGSSVR